MVNKYLEYLCAGIIIFSAIKSKLVVSYENANYDKVLVEQGWTEGDFKAVLNAISNTNRNVLKLNGAAWAIELFREYILQTYPNTQLFSKTETEGDSTHIYYKVVSNINLPKYSIVIDFSIVSY